MSSNSRSACSAKAEVCRCNHMPFINKTLSKEIMKRTKRNKVLKIGQTKTRKDICYSEIIAFNFCAKWTKYYGNLDEKKVSENKNFLENSKAFSFGKESV